MADATLDARGLSCPLPVLRARKAIAKLAPGQVLAVLATDPGTVKDFQAFAEATGHRLLEQNEGNGEFHYRIEKVGPA
jgi:tRNA 2-thiouridine synthesizing protein A